MEEVRCKPKKILWRFCEGNFKHTDGDNVFYFFLQSDDLTEVSKPPTLQTVKEDSDVMIGEGPSLDRPLTSLEKLHIIVGYAIVRRDLR